MTVPDQLLSAEYQDYVDSSVVNRRFRDIRPLGIYSGGYIALESATSIRVKSLVCEINSIYLSTLHQVRLETTSDTLMTALVSTQIYVVARWQYSPVRGDNDAQILVVSLANIQTYDIVLGVLTWNGGGTAIIAVSYYDSTNLVRRDTPECPEQLLKVVPHPSGGRNVMVKYGRAAIGSVLYTVDEQQVACTTAAGFIYVNSAGNLIFEAGASYTGKLVLGAINTDAVIIDSSITDMRSFTSLPSSSSNYGSASSITAFDIAKDAGTGADGQGSFYDVSGMSVSVTTTGGPLFVNFNGSVGQNDNTRNWVRLLVGTTLIAKKLLHTGDGCSQIDASLSGVLAVAAGTYTIKAQVWPKGSAVKNIWNASNNYENRRNLIAIELG